MLLQKISTLLAFIFTILAYVPYLHAVVYDGARPTVSCWLSWFILDLAILAPMLATRTIAPQMLAYVIGTLLVIVTILCKRVCWDWKWLDTFCVFVVACAAGAWYISGDPALAVWFGLGGTIVATIPLFRNIWLDPSREPMRPFVWFLIGSIFGTIAIPEWSVIGASIPLWGLVSQIAMVWLISRKYAIATV